MGVNSYIRWSPMNKPFGTIIKLMVAAFFYLATRASEWGQARVHARRPVLVEWRESHRCATAISTETHTRVHALLAVPFVLLVLFDPCRCLAICCWLQIPILCHSDCHAAPSSGSKTANFFGEVRRGGMLLSLPYWGGLHPITQCGLQMSRCF